MGDQPKIDINRNYTFYLNGEMVTVEVDINFQSLQAQMFRAAGSKSGKSVDGPVRVRVTERRKAQYLGGAL